MEFFIPGLFLFLVAIIVSFLIAPRVTPLIAAVLSIVFLTLGVYEHYKMFASEYRLSTWQDGLKIYAPAIMIGAILIFIIYGIFAFFTKGSVPVPIMPTVTAPSEDTMTNTVMNSLHSVVNKVNNVVNNKVNNVVNNKVNNTVNNKNKNINNKNITRSMLETI